MSSKNIVTLADLKPKGIEFILVEVVEDTRPAPAWHWQLQQRVHFVACQHEMLSIENHLLGAKIRSGDYKTPIPFKPSVIKRLAKELKKEKTRPQGLRYHYY